MKNQNTIEATTLNNLLGLTGFNESVCELRFLYKEIVHFVDLDAYTKEDQIAMYFFNECTDLLSDLNSLYTQNHKSNDLDLMDRGLSIIEKIKGTANGDLIKYFESVSDLAVFYIDYDSYCEETRNALHSLKFIKEALVPLINECFPSEEITQLKNQLHSSQERVKELEMQICGKTK